MPVEFHDYSVEVKKALQERAIEYLETAGLVMQRQAANNTRVGFGQTAGKWDYAVDDDKQVCTVGNPLENAIWEEFGTGEFALEGKGRKGAWYVPVDGYTGKKRPTYNGRVVVVYGKDGKKYYKTNGKKPTRALHNAFVTKKNALIQLAERIFGELK